MAIKTKNCPYCDTELYADALRCPSCGQNVPNLKNVCGVCNKEGETRYFYGKEYCRDCLNTFVRSVKISSTPNLDGYRIVEHLGIETAVIVLGTGIFSEVSSEISDLFGQRSSSFEKKITEAKNTAFDKLCLATRRLRGDAIVGLTISLTEFSGNRVGLVAYGTVVRIEKN